MQLYTTLKDPVRAETQPTTRGPQEPRSPSHAFALRSSFGAPMASHSSDSEGVSGIRLNPKP